MNKKNLIVILVVLVAAAVLYFNQGFFTEHLFRGDEGDSSTTIERALLREVSTEITYEVPGGEDTVRFSLFLDDDGRVADLESINVEDPDNQEHLGPFSDELLTVINGKKLSELQAVDKIGSSSLTTEAFNSGLQNLKAQL